MNVKFIEEVIHGYFTRDWTEPVGRDDIPYYVETNVQEFAYLKPLYIFTLRKLGGIYPCDYTNGEVAQWLGHRIANRKVSSSSPALSTVLRV